MSEFPREVVGPDFRVRVAASGRVVVTAADGTAGCCCTVTVPACACSGVAGCGNTGPWFLYAWRCVNFQAAYTEPPHPERCCCGPCEGRRYRIEYTFRQISLCSGPGHPPQQVERNVHISGAGTMTVSGVFPHPCVYKIDYTDVWTGDTFCGALPPPASGTLDIGSSDLTGCGLVGVPGIPNFTPGSFPCAIAGVRVSRGFERAGCGTFESAGVVLADGNFGSVIFEQVGAHVEIDRNDAVCRPAAPVGACCLENTCVECMTEEECAKAGGRFAGVGVKCFDAGCFPRARCCLDGGGCLDLSAGDCAALGGKWVPGASCADPGPKCPGACCIANGDGTTRCEQKTAEECLAASGVFFVGQDCADVDCRLFYETRLCPCSGDVTGFQMPVVDPACWAEASAGGVHCPVWRIPTSASPNGYVCVEAVPGVYRRPGPGDIVLCEGSDPWGCCGCCEDCGAQDFAAYRIDYHLGVGTRTELGASRCCCDPSTSETTYTETIETYFLVGGSLVLRDKVEVRGTISATQGTVHRVHTDYGFEPPVETPSDVEVPVCRFPLATVEAFEGIQEGVKIAGCGRLEIDGVSDNTGSGGAKIVFSGLVVRTGGSGPCAGGCESPPPLAPGERGRVVITSGSEGARRRGGCGGCGGAVGERVF